MDVESIELDDLSRRRSSIDDHINPDSVISSDRSRVVIGPDGLPLDVIAPHEKDLESPTTRTHEEEEEDKGEKVEEPHRQRRFATVMCCLNSMLGAGILSVPNTFINTGTIFSLAILVVIAILSQVATVLVIKLAHETNSSGLPELAFKILGKGGSVTLSVMNLLFLETALVAYLVLGSDMVMSWFMFGGIDLSSLVKRAILVLVYGLILPIALTFPRKVGFLQYISTCSIGAIAFFVVCMVYKAIVLLPKQGINPTCVLFKADITLFASLSIYGLSFALPAVVLPAIHYYNPDVKKRITVSGAAITSCAILVIIPSVCGYLAFGADTKANVLQSFDDKDILMTVVRAGFFVVVTCAYPMVSQSVMAAWGQVLFKDDDVINMVTCKRTIVVAITSGIPMIISMFLPNVKPALGIGGALGGCIVDFIFPSIMWIQNSRHNGGSIKEFKNILCILFSIFGLVAAILSTYQAVIDAIAAFN